MKYTVLKCDCCGKEFYSEYWTGGYIDHYMNFVGNLKSYISKGTNYVYREICFNENKRRRVTDVQERLNCFKIYCEKTELSDVSFVEEVVDLCNKYCDRQNYLDELHDKIVDMVKDLDDFEQQYIGLEYQAFYSKRLKI